MRRLWALVVLLSLVAFGAAPQAAAEEHRVYAPKFGWDCDSAGRLTEIQGIVPNPSWPIVEWSGEASIPTLHKAYKFDFYCRGTRVSFFDFITQLMKKDPDLRRGYQVRDGRFWVATNAGWTALEPGFAPNVGGGALWAYEQPVQRSLAFHAPHLLPAKPAPVETGPRDWFFLTWLSRNQWLVFGLALTVFLWGRIVRAGLYDDQSRRDEFSAFAWFWTSAPIVIAVLLNFLDGFLAPVAALLLWPVLLAFVIGSAWLFVKNFETMLKGWHYLFVPHPAENTVPGVWRRPMERMAFVKTLRSDAGDLANPPPAYKSQNMAHKARALADKLGAQAKLAEAYIRRERARAAAGDERGSKTDGR